MSEHIQHVWEFRTGCHNADDTHAQPCGCNSCTSKRVAAVAERPDLDDDAYVQFVGDKTRYSVRELRAASRAVRTAAEAREEVVPPAPDSYQRDLAVMRAALATSVSTFEDRWKAERLAALAAEPGRVAALRAAHGIHEPRFTVLSAEELNKYAPPDPYAAGIKALQARDARALAAKEKNR